MLPSHIDASVGDFAFIDIAHHHGRAVPATGLLQGARMGAKLGGARRPIVTAIVGGKIINADALPQFTHTPGDGALAHTGVGQRAAFAAAAQNAPLLGRVIAVDPVAQGEQGIAGEFVGLALVYFGAVKGHSSGVRSKSLTSSAATSPQRRP